jgi:activator of HSP90 ATPase
MKKLIKTYSIEASAEKVYAALTQPEIMTTWSGTEAENDPVEGGAFKLWGGSIFGKNTTVAAHQIVQDWQEENWDNSSKVTFNINESNGATEVELIHEDIPESSYNSISNGWDEYYMLPLKALVEGQN